MVPQACLVLLTSVPSGHPLLQPPQCSLPAKSCSQFPLRPCQVALGTVSGRPYLKLASSLQVSSAAAFSCHVQKHPSKLTTLTTTALRCSDPGATRQRAPAHRAACSGEVESGHRQGTAGAAQVTRRARGPGRLPVCPCLLLRVLELLNPRLYSFQFRRVCLLLGLPSLLSPQLFIHKAAVPSSPYGST